MTLYDLVNSMTIQGNIEIRVFNEDGDETTYRTFCNVDDLSVCDLDAVENMRVTYMYSIGNSRGNSSLIIELQED